MKRTLSTILALLLLAALAVPAVAEDDEDHDYDDEAESGPLEVELRPAVADVGAPVQIRVEIEQDDDDSDEASDDEDLDGDETDDDESDGEEADGDALGVWSVTVDLGDGTEPVQIALEAEDGDEDELEGRMVHAYAAEGVYPITVTATPEGGTPTQVTVHAQIGGGTARLSRSDRFGTSVRISEEAFAEDGSAAAVLLARGDSFADALAASSLTLVEDAAVLLTTPTAIPPVVLAEVQRVLAPAGTVYVFGGESAVGPEVVATLEALGLRVVRIAGVDRIDTSVQIARFLLARGVEIDEVVLAGAGSFPDALAIGPYAAEEEVPVLLTGRTQLDPRVLELLREIGDVDVTVVGGPAVVGDEVVSELEALGYEVRRLSGKDRFETAAAIAEATAPDAQGVVLATGAGFADALAGSSYAARTGAPVLLVAGELPASVRDVLERGRGRLRRLAVLGGEGAVPEAVRQSAEALLTPAP
jgi:putative cell wall-binding protein